MPTCLTSRQTGRSFIRVPFKRRRVSYAAASPASAAAIGTAPWRPSLGASVFNVSPDGGSDMYIGSSYYDSFMG